MAQSARLRRDRDRDKRPAQSKKRKKDYAVEEAVEEVELFKVEKIVDRKLDKNGVTLYKTRWKGYSASDDTWEPPENVASTGHIDRYERQQRQRTLKKSTAGVAVIEYEDGEREMVDMKIEKFRGYRPDSSDEERDDDTVNGDDDVNNFTLLAEGQWIEILWHCAVIYFPCKVISWTPLRAKRQQKKSARNSLRKGVFGDVEESPHSKQKQLKPTSKRTKRGANAPAKNSESELAVNEPTQRMFWKNDESMHKPGVLEEDQSDSDDSSLNSESSGLSEDRSVQRVGHGIPLFDEPEDDFDDDDSDDDEEGVHPYQRPSHNERPKLSFEEAWALKLKRTQELIGQGL
mmetsp:Transcript_27581/g.58917  ORF Transcript_27581/g.58917 Transcript_27581/m.58917 type:complete len:346 (-) Transcript_27581:1625-2662(-)